MRNTPAHTLLLERFDTLATLPNGVKKLRDLILQLAIQGKLVPQDPSDEPASVLLEKIQSEKARLVKAGQLKKQKPLPPIDEADVPFQLPPNWQWVRLGEVCHLISDGSHNPPTKQVKGIPMLSSQNVFGGKIDYSASRYVDEQAYLQELKRTPIKPNDILLTIVASIGRSAIVPSDFKPFCLQRSVALLKTLIPPFYLPIFFDSPVAIQYFTENAKGTAQKGIYLGQLNRMPLPLPPFAEQQRIVAKVDALMAVCDALEAQRNATVSQRKAFLASSLKHIEEAKTPEDAMRYWHSLHPRLAECVTTKEDVKALRNTVLQLAIQGKLVPQDPSDEPASVLLEKIQAEKARLVKAGQLKKQKPLPPIDESYVPFQLPPNWQWVRLGEVVNIKMGNSPSGLSYNTSAKGLPLINGPVEFGQGDYEKTILSKWTTEPTQLCEKGDLLVCVRGSTTGRLNLAGFNACIGRGVAALKPFILERRYTHNFMVSYKGEFIKRGTGTTFPSVSQSEISNIYFPLPPLAEQQRIVAKVDELMAVCDALEAHLETRHTHATALLESIVHHIVHPQQAGG